MGVWDDISTEELFAAYWDRQAMAALAVKSGLLPHALMFMAEMRNGGDAPPAPPSVERVDKPGVRNDADVLIRYVDAGARLSRRVRQVFDQCLIEGLSIQECADKLGIGYETVRTHLRTLRRMVPRRFYDRAA